MRTDFTDKHFFGLYDWGHLMRVVIVVNQVKRSTNEWLKWDAQMTAQSLYDVFNALGKHTCYLDEDSNEIDPADVNQLDWAGDPLLVVATRVGNLRAVETLLDSKANPNLAGESGYTALHYAAMYDHREIAILLLAYGADKQRTTDFGRRPIDVAIAQNATTVIEVLSKK